MVLFGHQEEKLTILAILTTIATTQQPNIDLPGQVLIIDESEILGGMKSEEEEGGGEGRQKKKKVQKGGYKTKEEIHKPPTFDHPCNLTRTTVRISYPKLKHELFVNFLGYKEPNLVYLWRCKGTCGEATSPIACSPTRTSEKRVNMMFKVKVCIFRSRKLCLISGFACE